jgi:hypothetical protein
MVKRGLTGCDRILKIFKPRVQAYRNMGTPVIGPFCVSNRTASSGAAMKRLRAVLVEHDWDGVGLLAMTIYEQHRANRNFREKSTGPDEYACHVFELAEHTPRRLASYQQLAEARLAQSVSPAPVGATESF